VCELSSSTHLPGAQEGGPGRQVITISRRGILELLAGASALTALETSLLNCCNIAISLTDPENGEQTAQACANACSHQLSSVFPPPGSRTTPEPNAHIMAALRASLPQHPSGAPVCGRCHVVELVHSRESRRDLIQSCGSAIDGVAAHCAGVALELDSDGGLSNDVGFYGCARHE